MRLEPKVDGTGLNLTRATLDAATKYPWLRRPGLRKFGAYADDAALLAWVREGAPAGRCCLEAQIMDWADDVAYSVHDVEDGILSGRIDLAALQDADTAATICDLVATTYLPGTDPADLRAALDRLVGSPAWPTGYSRYTGSLRDLAALKDLTSQLIGRFTAAAETATREAHPQPQLTRYSGSLEVPTEIRHEVGVLKGIANLFVMQRRGSTRSYARQRGMISELVAALVGLSP